MGQNTKVLFALFLVACVGASIFVLRKGQNVAPLSAAKNSAVAVAPAVPLPSAAATQPIVDGSIVTSQMVEQEKAEQETAAQEVERTTSSALLRLKTQIAMQALKAFTTSQGVKLANSLAFSEFDVYELEGGLFVFESGKNDSGRFLMIISSPQKNTEALLSDVLKQYELKVTDLKRIEGIGRGDIYSVEFNSLNYVIHLGANSSGGSSIVIWAQPQAFSNVEISDFKNQLR